MSDSFHYGILSYDFSSLTSTPQQNSSDETVGYVQDVDATDKKRQEIISALAKNLNPFSCINPIYNFVIIDKKTFLRSENNVFVFKDKALSAQQKEHAANQSLGLTNRLDVFLKENWFSCKQNFDNFFKSRKQIVGLTEEQNKKLSQYLEKSQKITLLMLGKDPTYHRQAPFFALQFDQGAKESLKKNPVKYGDIYLISRYIIFSKTQPSSLLNFSISFDDKLRDKALQTVFKNNQGVYKRNKLYCEVTLEDRHRYFYSVIKEHNFEQNTLLSRFRFSTYRNIVEYPFKEPAAKRRKYIPESSYSLAFQGGGVKGAAYVGAYKAIRQMKKDAKDAKAIPITSIIGSSAGGMIALAISTGIEPHEVEKICYRMSAIPSTDRFVWQDIKSGSGKQLTFEQVISKQKGILQKVKKILNEYGIVNQGLVDKLIEFYKKRMVERFLVFQTFLNEFLLAFMPSVGQILDFKQGKDTKFNMAGLLLEGALMKGEAVYNIGADCLVKHLLSGYDKYSKAAQFPSVFSPAFAKELSQVLTDFHGKFEGITKMGIALLGKKEQNRVYISIINKIILLVARVDPEYFFITEKFVKSLSRWFVFNINVHNLAQFINSHKKISESKSDGKTEKGFKLEKRRVIEQHIDVERGINYRVLSQILDEEYLLNPVHFKPKAQEFKKATVQSFLSDIFPDYAQRLFKDRPEGYRQEVAESVVYTFAQENLAKNPHFKQVDEYATNYEKLKTAVKKITMQQYYKLTKIEFTCTSVDLDGKILRFFNHKTTPDLPVCRAVQMTGSFPVGFKAQHWQKQWGKYLVHYQNVRREVDVENHEFTDGGVLANFPIKYFDNDTIRDTYFSHMTSKNEQDNKTILLGFGLDQLDPNSYSPSEKQALEKFNQTTLIERARVNLNDALDKLKDFKFWQKAGIAIKELIPLWNSMKKAQRDAVPWKAINHALLNEVPVLRLGIRLLESYPRADRNLNLECFENSIFITDLPAVERTFAQRREDDVLEVKEEIKKLGGEEQKQLGKQPIDVNKPPVDIEKNIKEQIDSAPMNRNILKKAFAIFSNFRERCLADQKGMGQAQKLQKQRVIKQKLLNIIYYKMRLMSKEEIEKETLRFMDLKLMDFTDKDLSLKMSDKKIEVECERKNYHKIESELPFKDFNEKMYKAELQDKANSKKAQTVQIEQVKAYLKDTSGIWLIRAAVNKYEDRAEFISLPSYYLTHNLKYLVQYIFLSKINNEGSQQLMERANEVVNRTSYQDLLLSYDLKSRTSYITIRDLKNFYRRLFNRQKVSVTRAVFDLATLKSEQELIPSQKDDFRNLDTAFYKIVKTDRLGQAGGINEDVSPNVMENEGYQFLRTTLHQIQFASIVREAFSDEQKREEIESQLSRLHRARGQKSAKVLSKKLELQSNLTAKDLQRLTANPRTSLQILDILYRTEYEDYSHDEAVDVLLQAKYLEYCGQKNKQLEKEVSNQVKLKTKQNSLSSDTNPLQLKINYLVEIELTLVYLLLKKALQDDKQVGFDLEQAKIGSPLLPDNADEKNRKKIREEMQEEDAERKEDDDGMIRLVESYQRDIQILMIYIIQIQQALYDFTQQQNRELEIVRKLSQYSDTISKSMGEIKNFMINRLSRLVNMPSREITVERIKDAYTLEYNAFRSTCEALFKSIKLIIDGVVTSEKRMQQSTSPNLIQANINFLQQEVLASFKSLDGHKFQLPNFQIHWNFYQKQFRFGQYSREMNECLGYQLTHSFIEKWKGSITKQQEDDEKEGRKIKEIKVHVILQGLDMANVYYPYFYEIFSKFKAIKHKGQDNVPELHNIQRCLNRIEIRAITTSSYHSIFGFLIALKLRDEEIKNEMVAIRQIALTFQNKKMVAKNFENYQWIRSSPQDYKQLWNYILQEQINLFGEMEKLVNKRAESHSIQGEFGKIKDMYLNEEQSIHKSCQLMIDEMAQSISRIDNEAEAKNKTLEIAKTYGINYTCSLNQEHAYETRNTQNFKLYENIIKKIFTFYGSLFEGMITNVLTAQGRINLSKEESKDIYKGIFMKQLLSVFKIRSYVIEKLKKKKIKENITLLQFFNEAPQKILLNFTTLNIDDSRLHFMNKNTMPNIPLWAAVVASTSHPFFYREFESSKDWENPVFDKASLFQRIVDDFFTTKATENNHVKYASGNMISSLPMELLTNERIVSQMFTFEKTKRQRVIIQDEKQVKITEQVEQPYLYLGFAFNGFAASYKNPTFVLQKNFLLDFSGFEVVWQGIKGIGGWAKGFIVSNEEKNCPLSDSKHETTNFDQTSSLGDKMANLLGSGQSLRTVSIFTESNDNFVFHSYSDKLVKLPIKIGTLDFHYIMDKQMQLDYGVTLPSHRVKQTIERSYEITKYFSRKYFVTEGSPTFNEEKFRVNVRVKVVVKESGLRGVKIYFAKVELLSHSKWNRNRFNNFVVDYSVDEKNFSKTVQRAENSELLWKLNESSRIFLRFYFPHHGAEGSLVNYTQIVLDVSNLVEELPLTNSYDYSFNFYDCMKGDKGERLLAPFRKNQYDIIGGDKKHPELRLSQWKAEEMDCDTTFYIQPLKILPLKTEPLKVEPLKTQL